MNNEKVKDIIKDLQFWRSKVLKWYKALLDIEKDVYTYIPNSEVAVNIGNSISELGFDLLLLSGNLKEVIEFLLGFVESSENSAGASESIGIICGVCGVEFKNEEAYEKHIFKVDGKRCCGIAVLRAIEKNPELAKKVFEERFKYHFTELMRR
ncbi:hypothetical protein J7J18_02600 [bacterium]|nr:hypothetical protein [bacterium]